jgi:hypothetical protein
MIKICTLLLFLVNFHNVLANKKWLILVTEGYVKQIHYPNRVGEYKLWSGDTLEYNARVRVPIKGYLAYLDLETGEAFEISKAGDYQLHELNKKNIKDFRRIVENHFSLLYQADREDHHKRIREYVAITGLKYRCRPDSRARIYYPDVEDTNGSSVGCHGDFGGKILSDTLHITLYNIDTTSEFNTYIVRMRDLYEKVCMEREVIGEKNPYKITTLSINMCNQEELLLSTVFKEEKLSEKSKLPLWLIKKVDTNAVLSYQDIKKIKVSLQKNPSAIEYFLLSKIYEKEGLLLESLDAIQKCTQLQPHVITYSNIYHDFLKQYKFCESGYQDKKPIFIFTELNKKEHQKYLRIPKKL